MTEWKCWIPLGVHMPQVGRNDNRLAAAINDYNNLSFQRRLEFNFKGLPQKAVTEQEY